MSDEKVENARQHYLRSVNSSYWRNMFLLGLLCGVFGVIILVYGVLRDSLWTPLFLILGSFFICMFIILFISYFMNHNKTLEDFREKARAEEQQELQVKSEEVKEPLQVPETVIPEKRKRGRPKKIKQDEVDAKGMMGTGDIIVVKRKRGRPKKTETIKHQTKKKVVKKSSIKKKKQVKKVVKKTSKKMR